MALTRRTALSLIGAAACAQPRRVPDRTVVLTFDDGVVTHATYVAPLLKKLGFGGTFFVCEFPPNFADKSLYMSWEQMAGLHKLGFEVANHTLTHKPVDRITREKFDEELRALEMKAASLGVPKMISFAYPGYHTHDMAFGVLKAQGYKFARAGLDRAYDPAKDNPLLIPSYTIKADNRDQIRQALPEARDGKIVVLTVHGVPDTAHPWVTTPPELFEEHMHFLKEQKYHVIAMRDLTQFV